MHIYYWVGLIFEASIGVKVGIIALVVVCAIVLLTIVPVIAVVIVAVVVIVEITLFPPSLYRPFHQMQPDHLWRLETRTDSPWERAGRGVEFQREK